MRPNYINCSFPQKCVFLAGNVPKKDGGRSFAYSAASRPGERPQKEIGNGKKGGKKE